MLHPVEVAGLQFVERDMQLVTLCRCVVLLLCNAIYLQYIILFHTLYRYFILYYAIRLYVVYITLYSIFMLWCRNKTIMLWDIRTNKLVQTIADTRLHYPRNALSALLCR